MWSNVYVINKKLNVFVTMVPGFQQQVENIVPMLCTRVEVNSLTPNKVLLQLNVSGAAVESWNKNNTIFKIALFCMIYSIEKW